MKEIRIHGRGGQGSVLAAELLAVAAFEDNKYGQAFPAFGGERRGAPVQAFFRLDDRPIRVRYRVTQPDYVVILDRTLPNIVDVLNGIKTGGLALIDSEKSPDELAWTHQAQVYPVPATRIAMQVFGQPLVNPAMLGALAAVSHEINLPAIQKAFQQRFPGLLGDKNCQAAQMGFDAIQSGAVKPIQVQPSSQAPGANQQWQQDPALGAPGQPLHFALVVGPRTALAYPTGSWRYTRPIVNEKICTGCGVCVLYCPDSSLKISDKLAIVDYGFCKGCGICAEECSRDAIVMVSEEE